MLFSTLATASLLSLAAAAPTAIEKRFPPLTNILRPSVISRYQGFDGAIFYNVGLGIASKSPTNGGRDLSTLVTFENTSLDLPATCTLRFFIDNSDTSAVIDGTKQVAIYSSLNPAPPQGSKGWGGPGNQRDQDLGRLQVYKGSNANVLQGYPSRFENVPCPKRGAGPVGYEVVPVGDTDQVEWTAGLSGLYLTWA